MAESDRFPAAAGPAPAKVTWRRNPLRRAARVSSLLSLAMSVGLLLLASVSIWAGDRSLLTLLVLVLSFFLLDGAATRLLASARAPSEIGLSEFGVHIRSRRGEQSIPWTSITDVRYSSIAPRPALLTLTLRTGETLSFQGILSAIATEVKLAWFEASARDRAQRRAVARVSEGAPRPSLAAFEDLLPTSGPQYWTPAAEPQGAPSSPAQAGASAEALENAAARPDWGYTRVADGANLPDPRYSAAPASVRPFVWHFIPTAGTRLGGTFLMALLVLAGIAVTRLAADALLSVAGLPSDPWLANLIGLAAGLALAAAAWRLARGELVGEVAGSVLFLPAFDRTKGEIVSTLRDAGATVGVGEPRERRVRGRLVVRWPSAHTRATILQASPDTRAIVLRTVGRANFDVHLRFKGAILERLRGPSIKR